MITRGIPIVVITIVISALCAHATWKPEYGKSPQEVQDWFKQQVVPTESAQARLHFSPCCDHADRVRAKIITNADHDEWWYTEEDCTGDCKPKRIPDDVVHQEDIPIGHSPEAQEVFRQLRAEGILMVYNGQITCFWPPQTGI